jgi:hypothetical protein
VDSRRAWHGLALGVFACAAALTTQAWFTADRMPPGDFPGYAAQVKYVHDVLMQLGRVPRWCVECYGGTTNFTASWKEVLVLPLSIAFDPVLATKLAFVLLRVVGAFGLYWLAARELAAPAAGIAAGIAYSWGALANGEIEHLDVAVATALLPYLWICAVALLRSGRALAVIGLGLAVAFQFANNWVHAATAPFAVLGLALVRPWQTGDRSDAPWRDLAVARRYALAALAALVVFAALAASPIAWLIADAQNHSLLPAQVTETQRGIYVERSPFLFANRDDALAPWLASHQPPYGVAIADGGRRYLGLVVVAVIAAGWIAARRDPLRRRWAALAGLTFLLQYWLALGPRTLLWEVATSFHWTAGTAVGVAWGLRGVAVACALGAVAWRARAAQLATAALLLFFPTVSLWSACASFLPMFAAQRSPGHFFDTAPFGLALAFAACLAALAARIAQPRIAHAAVAAVGVALVIDFAPSARGFAAGEPLAQVRESEALVAHLLDEGATMRIGLGPGYSPLASWILAQAPAGQAWGWLRWQSGKYWWDSYATAAFGAMLAEPDSGAWSERYAPLLRAARVRRLLLPERAPPPPAPWQRANGDGRFALWEQPDVSPVAVGYSAWRVWDGEPGRAEAAAAVEALREDEITVSPPATTSGGPQRGPIAVAYRRPTPEWIRLALDAGRAPVLVFVSEGYHPWWHAYVDGAPAPVWRAALAHLAVPVGPGKHQLEVRFEPPALVAAADVLTTNAWIALAVWLIWRKFPPGGLRKLRELARRPEHPLWDEMHRPRTERPRAARQDRN